MEKGKKPVTQTYYDQPPGHFSASDQVQPPHAPYPAYAQHGHAPPLYVPGQPVPGQPGFGEADMYAQPAKAGYPARPVGQGEQPPTQTSSDQPPVYSSVAQNQVQPAPAPAPYPGYGQPGPAQPGYGQPAPSQPGHVQPGVYGQPAPAGPGVQGTNIILLHKATTHFGESPIPMKCTSCHADITTTTSYEVGTLAWLICAVMFFVGLGFAGLLWFCSFIPFCVPGCKDVIHRCPSCNIELGRLRRM